MNQYMRQLILLMAIFSLVACGPLRTPPTPEPALTITPRTTIVPPLLPVTPVVTPTATTPPTPEPTLSVVAMATTTATPTPTTTAVSCTHLLAFIADVTIADVTIADDSQLPPNTLFTKVWRVQNQGTCPWPTGSSWVFVDGHQLSGPDVVALPAVAPGETADIAVNFITPTTPGNYTSSWQLRLPNGMLVNQRCYTRITVVAPTAIPTPTATATPTATPQAKPIIHAFYANKATANPGETIELHWTTSQTTAVSLQKQHPTGQPDQQWQLEPNGSLRYAISPSERDAITFVLTAQDNAQQEIQALLTIMLNCPHHWFFADAPAECPAAPPLMTAAAEQPFEHGTMIWVEAQDQIYVLFEDGQTPAWWVYADEWDVGDVELNPDLVPPADLYQPIRNFGQVWREAVAVRDRLGWATAPAISLTTAVQQTNRLSHNDTYIRSQENSIWHLYPDGSRWEQMQSPIQ